MSTGSIFVRLADWLGWTSSGPIRVTPSAIDGSQTKPFPVPPSSLPAPNTPIPEPPENPKTDIPGSGAESLSELYDATLAYKSSIAYRDLLEYMARFRNYSSYNLFLVRVQKPDARYIATIKHWKQAFGRHPKAGARALIMLQPGGPVMFVYDLADTDGKAAPKELLEPFYAEGQIPELVWKTVLRNCKREGFTIAEADLPPTLAGFVEGSIGEHSVPPFFKITLNVKHNDTARFVLAHELAHVYCGHLGGHPAKRWPDRTGVPLEVREFEAESTAYIVAKRRNIESGSDRYLADYLDTHSEVPPVDVELVVKVADRIEKMGYRLRPLRKNESEETTD